ncbi:MAG TPA: AI-2E family transporter [Synechococcales cyanobacterium M55_K2018_004]|nr:AI-2E family transporter [Synechococcales cyanobacterium M55_K2018_004]
MQPPSSEPSSHQWQTLSNSALLRYLLLFAGGCAIVFLLNYFYTTIVVFSVSGLLAALLNYPVVFLARYMPRWLAITLTFLGAIAFLLALIAFLGLQVLEQGQALANRINERIAEQEVTPLQDWLDQLDFDRLLSALQTGVISGVAIANQLFASKFVILFGLVISLYMLIDGAKLWQMALKLVPAQYRERFGYSFQRSFLGFLRGQIVLIIYFTVTTLLALTVLGVDYALLLGLIAGLLDAVPGIGAVIAVVLITLLAFAAQGPITGIKVLIAMLLIEQLQENYVRPKIMGDELEVNPVLLFLALFIGQRVAGLLGVFLAIPIAGMIAAWIRSAAQDAASSEEPRNSPAIQASADDAERGDYPEKS